ncbi:MAG: transcription antitermination factor NusB [Clostridiales bacterium]|nr:transcription antitermination factor NusB [Clostridiales bacterium]
MSNSMSRREIREYAFKLVFEYSFRSDEEQKELIELYRQSNPVEKEEDWKEIMSKFDGVVEKVPEIDEILNRLSRGWKTTRMNKADLSVLRVAVYEILFDEDVPDSVAINEAVEITKLYSGEESSSFVNGLLASVVREKAE